MLGLPDGHEKCLGGFMSSPLEQTQAQGIPRACYRPQHPELQLCWEAGYFKKIHSVGNSR